MTRRLSVPFGLTLLALLGLIVVPLAGALLWLGAETADTLEHRNVHQRMTALSSAVENFLRSGLQQIVLMGATLADTPGFRPTPGLNDAEDLARLTQLAGMLGRHSLVAAAFVGYADGHFLYAGRANSLSGEQRAVYGAADDAIILRRVDDETAGSAGGGTRRETWWLRAPDGRLGPPHSRPTDYDPRRRPWYVEAQADRRAALTEPYVFADADVVGISAGLPLPDGAGAFGFDITIDQVSALIANYKITRNSVIMVGSVHGSVFAQTRACSPATERDCLPGGGAARLALGNLMRDYQGNQRLQGRIGQGDGEYELFVETMPALLGRSFVVAAAVPVVELSADSRALLAKSAIAAAIAVGVAVLAALAGSLLLSRPLTLIARKTERIRHLDFGDRAPVRSRIAEVARLSEAVERMRDGLETFGHYVSRGLVEQIMRSPERTGLRGARRDVTVMFTDIEGFARIAEQLRPEVLTRRLSHYFETLAPAISENRGTIDKYIGDSIMAYWNAPETDDEHVFHACRAALRAAAASRALAVRWQGRSRPVFRTRIGLHTGPAVVGNVGTRERINYTLVGPVANQASRLEGLNKVYGTDVLASGDVMRAVAGRFVWRGVDRVVAAGTTEALDLYEPLAARDDPAAVEFAGFLELWDAARADYGAGRFDAALARFRAAAALRPDASSQPDGPCRVFIARCTELQRSGVPAGWDGIWRHDRK